MAGDGLGAYLEHGPVALYSALDYGFFLSELGLHRIRYIHTESHSEHFRKDGMVSTYVLKHYKLSFQDMVRNYCKHLLMKDVGTTWVPMLQKSQNQHQLTIHFSLQYDAFINTLSCLIRTNDLGNEGVVSSRDPVEYIGTCRYIKI